MGLEFYDVKLRKKVQLDDGQIKKVKITQKNGQVRYAFRGVTEDGRNLTRFCSEADWKAASYPEA